MRIILTAMAASAALLCASGSSVALPSHPVTGGAILPEPVRTLADTSAASAPIAYLRFCHLNPDQCRAAASGAARISLSEQTWGLLRAVNARINDRIAPDSSKGAFDWSVTATVGNCNDYAVQKRKALLEMGFPASALSLAVVVTPEGVGHLLLTVRTDRGDFVLDNLQPSVVPWTRANYRWVMRQSSDDPNEWTSVDPFAHDAAPRIIEARASTRAPAPRRDVPARARPIAPPPAEAAASVEEPKTVSRPVPATLWLADAGNWLFASIAHETAAPPPSAAEPREVPRIALLVKSVSALRGIQAAAADNITVLAAADLLEKPR